MKTKLLGVALILLSGVFGAWADLEVSGSIQIHATADFETPLAAQGAWVATAGYGRCWRPARVAVDWRPYCNGEWVWTDCGWYWQSDEPWAWACYHYGSWVYDGDDGWVWVPDVEWAPAWVVWREGGGYIGWAPMPPRRGGLAVDVAVPVAPFVFVQTSQFHGAIRPGTVIVNDRTILARTSPLNNIRQETRSFDGGAHRVNFNSGPQLAEVQKATGNKVRTVAMREAVDRTPAPHFTARPVNESGGRTKSAEPSEAPNAGRENVRTPKDLPVTPAKPAQPGERREPTQPPSGGPLVPPRSPLAPPQPVVPPPAIHEAEPPPRPPGQPIRPVAPPPAIHEGTTPPRPPGQSPPAEPPKEKQKEHGPDALRNVPGYV